MKKKKSKITDKERLRRTIQSQRAIQGYVCIGNKMENRADRASVNAHGSLRGGLPQVHGRTDRVIQLNVLSEALLSAS